MRRRLCIVLLLVSTAVWPGAATAAYSVDGGTLAERATVRAGLAASLFPWRIVPARVRIHIQAGVLSHAVPGEIWLDSHLLDAGHFALYEKPDEITDLMKEFLSRAPDSDTSLK